MSTDFPKPPLAPKPSLDQVVPLIVCNHPSLALRPSLHQHPNLMSRGPKPPLAPKPVILLTAEGRSSIYINNSLNSCANGEMICYDTCLAAEEREDVEHQCKCLEFPPDDCILDSLDVEDTGKDNSVAGDGLTQTPVIMTVEDHASSDVAEPVDTGLDESAGTDGRCSPAVLCEGYSSKVHEEDASSQNEDEATDFENDEDKSNNELSFSIREGSQDIDLVKCNNEHNLENDCAFYVEDGLSKNCCDEDVVQLIPLDEETPHFKESNEEVDLPSNLEKGIAYDVPEVCSLNDALSDADADDLLEKESDLLNDNVVDVCVDDNPVDEEADDGLEMPEDAGSHAEMLSDESHNESWSEEVETPPEKVNADTTNSEIYGNIEQENNVDDGYETIEIKSEEESSEAAHDEREGSKDDSAEKDDSLDDSCQIIPFENDCNEDLVDVPHGYLDDFLHLDGGYSFQEAAIHEPAREAEMKFILKRNGVSECILEEEYENGEPDSDGQQFGDGKPLSEDKESGDISTEEGDENVDDDVALQDGELTEERDASSFGVHYECEYGSIDCLSLTDEDEENPYVLEHTVHSRGENSLHGERMGLSRSPDTAMSDQSMIGDLSVDIDNNLLSVDRKNIVTRSRSLSGKITGCVPETVPEESGPESDSQFINNDSLVDINTNQLQHLEGKHCEINRLLPAKPRRFIQYPRSYSAEGRDSPLSMYRESNGTSFEHSLFRRKDDNISLPCVLASSGSFSQRSHLSSSGVSTPTSGVDIPPPFELASITKKPITKSSPSLLIENESPDKYFKKKKSSFKRFLTLKFRKKTENKIHVDVNVSSSRSSSESSYHGPSRLVEMDRRSLGGSPQLKPHSGKMRSCDSPSAVLIYKDGKRKATPKTFSRSVARVESFEDRSRLPFMPLPLTKPRSISFPNADTSDYENIPAMNSDYENIQIPPRRPTRAGTFTEFFEDPSRALASANENDGYVDMSSFTTFEMKQQTPDHGAERYCKLLCKTC